MFLDFQRFQNFRSAVFSFFATNFHLFFPTMPFEMPIFLACELSGKESRHYILLRVIMRSTGGAVQYWGITLNNCLWNYNKRIFVSSATRSACVKILGSHACTKNQQIVTSVLVSTPWTSRRHHYVHWNHHHHLVVCFGYLLSVVVIHFFRYQSHFKSQTTRTTEKNLRTLRTDSQQIERLELTPLQKSVLIGSSKQ